MKNFTFHFRSTDTIDLNCETIRRVAEKLTNHYADGIEKAITLSTCP